MIQNHEPIWFNEEPSTPDTKKEAGYSLFVATPVHSECSIHYAQALFALLRSLELEFYQKWRSVFSFNAKILPV